MSPYEEVTPSPFLQIHLQTTSFPWRLTYAWVAFIGSLYALGPAHLWNHRLQLLGLLILCDIVWGTWGRLALTTSPSRERTSRVHWPYTSEQGHVQRLRWWFPAGTFTTFGGTLILAFFALSVLGKETAWLTGLALVGSIGLWAWARISPTGVVWGLPLYGWGLPLWAGGYVFGRGNEVLAGVAATLVVTYWALRWHSWKRALLGGIAIILWIGTTMGHIPNSLLGLTTLMWLTSLIAPRPSVGIEVLWGLTLTMFALGST